MSQRPIVVGQLLDKIIQDLYKLDTMQQSLADEDLLRLASEKLKMHHVVSRLHTTARGIPDPHDALMLKLQQADAVYGSRFLLVCVTSIVVVVLFVSLVGCGYRWIFLPIRMLHEGASRVAQGDFDYRVRLRTNDEMAELAEAFNQMTARFQEIAGDLDRQVRERSKQLVRSERLAGVGFLAAGVAHEINNPLSAITMATESLQGRMQKVLDDAADEEKEVVRQYLEMIGREAFRCQQITAKLLDFSRGQDQARNQNDLTTIISEVLALIRHMSKFRDRTIEFAQPQPCYLEFNGPEIKQVVLNLVANALESMDGGGTLEIALTEKTDQVVVTFQDDGCGMTPETVENLFEPFFTRKTAGKGTGLGLSISHRIVTDHGGTIEATSQGPGRGSTFRVFLPKSAALQKAA